MPALVFENTVVVGPALEVGTRPPSMKNVPGRILAFDTVTGERRWRFNTIPVKGEPGYDTWLDGGMGVATDSRDSDLGETGFTPFADTNADPGPSRAR